MLFKKQAVHDAWAAAKRTLDFKVVVKGKSYTATDISTLSYDSGAMNGEALTLGSTYTNTIKITFSHLIEDLALLDEITPQIGIQLPDGTWDFTSLGLFIIDAEVQQDRNNNTTTVSASDRMCMMGGTYESKLSYPAAINDIAVEIADMSGMKVNVDDFARLPTEKILSLGKVTYRDAIGYVAQFAGGFATFDRDGLLDIRVLSDPNFTVTPDQYQSKGLTKNEAFYRIGGLTCSVTTTVKDDSGSETQETTTLQSGSTAGTQIILNNPGMTQVLLDGLYEQLQDMNFYPFSLNWFGDPSLEAGDWITVQDTAGNEFRTPNLLYSLTFGGGVTATSKADTTITASANFVYRGATNQIITNIRRYLNAAGHAVSEGIDEPTSPKAGDIWFKKEGPDTTIMTYVIDQETGVGSWHEGPSTKVNAELQKLFEDLKEEMENTSAAASAAAIAGSAAMVAGNQASAAGSAAQSAANSVAAKVVESSKEVAAAKSAASSAVDQASQAVSAAGFANDAAYQAKTAAANAQADAANALSGTSLAQQDATKALASAQAALTSVTAANDTANRADSSASAAQASAQAAIKSAQTALSMASGADAKAEAAAKAATTADSNATDALSGANIALDSAATALNQARSAGSAATSTAIIAKSNQSAISTLATKASVNTLTSQVASTATLQKQTADELLSKADSSVVDSLTSTANSTSTLATQTATALKSKAEISTVNTVNSTATSAATLATQTATTLKSKADSTTVDKLTGRVSSAESKLTQTATKAELALTNTDVDKLNDTVASQGLDITATADALKLKADSSTLSNLTDTVADNSAQLALTATKAELALTQNDIDDLGDTVSNQGVKLAATATAAELAATQDNVDTLKKTVTNNTAGVTANAKQIALKANQTDVDTLKGTVTSQGAQVAVTASQVALKADTATVNNLGKTVASQGAQLSLTATEVDLEAAQSAVDAVTKTVTSNTAGMTANANALKLKADSSTVSTLDSRVTNLSGQLDVQANLISAKVTANDVTGMLNGYATQSWSQGQISAAKNEISASVETVKKTVNNMSVGGVNLLKNTTADVKTVSSWNNQYYKGLITDLNLSVGDPIIYSAFLDNTNAAITRGNSRVALSFYDADGQQLAWFDGNTIAHGTTGTSSAFARIPDRAVTLMLIEFTNNQEINTAVGKRMLERGTLVTDWQPAPEDQATVDWTKSQLDIKDGKISAAVTSLKSDITTATAGMATQTWTQGKLDLTADGLTSKISSVKNGLDTKYTSIEETLKGVQITANNAITQGQLSLLSDQLTSTITGVKNDLNNMQIGGRNLVLGTSNQVVQANNWNMKVADIKYDKSLGGALCASVMINNADHASVLAKGSAHIVLKTLNQSGNVLATVNGNEVSYNANGLSWCSIKIDDDTASIQAYILTNNMNANAYYSCLKIEKGTIATDWSPAPEDMATVADVSSQFTQLQNDINLRVKTGDLVSQIDVNAKRILLDGASTYITNTTHIDTGVIKSANIQDAAITSAKIGALAVTTANIGYAAVTNAEIAALAVGTAEIADGAITNAKIGNASITTAKIGDAQITSAKIASIAADKITTGTLDAALVNVININASKITTGTISGANLSINLTTGEILFQKGAIKSTNGNLNIDIDSGNMTVSDSIGDGFRFEDGKLFLTTKAWIDSFQSKPDYGYISYEPNFLSNVQGMQIAGTDGIAVTAGDYDTFSFIFQHQPNSGSALALHDNTAFLNAREHVRIEGGGMYTEAWPLTNAARAAIVVGGANGGTNRDGATNQYGSYNLQEPVYVGTDLFMKGSKITLQAGFDPSTTDNLQAHQLADLNLGNGGGRSYVSSAAIYNRTYSSGDHVVITNFGILGRLTSARKYKVADQVSQAVIDKAKRVLNIQPAEWYDKAEVESIADALTNGTTPMVDAKIEKHYGFIADDFDAAGLTEVVLYKGGEVDSLAYDRIPIYHNVILSDHEKRIAELETEVKQLKGEI